MTEQEHGFFAPVPSGGLLRPLGVAVLWAFAAALAGGAIVGLASLIAAGITGVVWLFDRSVSVPSAMADTLQIAAWIFAPIGIAISVWVAAYGSTQEGSIPRTLVAAPAAIAIAAGLLFLDSAGLLAAALALGWGLAIPAGSPVRAAARGLPVLIAALLVARLGDLSTAETVVYLMLSPIVAAAAVFLADLPWQIGGGGEPTVE